MCSNMRLYKNRSLEYKTKKMYNPDIIYKLPNHSIKHKQMNQTLDGSTPQAKYIAAVSLVALDNVFGSYGNVIYNNN